VSGVRRSSPLTFICIICYSVHSYYFILRLLLYYYTWAASQHKYYDFLLWHYIEIYKLFLLLKHHQFIYGILFYSVFYFAQLISKKKHSLMQSKSKRQLGYFVGYSCPYELNNLSDILRNQKQLCLYICLVLGLLNK
jgi:hypothetical protein